LTVHAATDGAAPVHAAPAAITTHINERNLQRRNSHRRNTNRLNAHKRNPNLGPRSAMCPPPRRARRHANRAMEKHLTRGRGLRLQCVATAAIAVRAAPCTGFPPDAMRSEKL
jgi:hypothetical protein